MNNNGQSSVLAYTVRQCEVCHRVLRWPVLTMFDAFLYDYLHCGKAAEFLEIAPKHERQPFCEVKE